MIFFYIFLIATWQQRVSYKITASLDTCTHSLTAVEYLTYYNNSPFPLETLYFHLYPNAYRDLNTIYAQETKRMGNDRFLKSKELDRGYIDIKSITAEGNSLKFIIAETIMALFLNQPLMPNDSITLKIDFYLKIPKIFSRLGYKGNHYEMVQWYPKPCVFDASTPRQFKESTPPLPPPVNQGNRQRLEGPAEPRWHKNAYHAIGEFYGEYGSFDVEIELPGNYVVAATGERMALDDKQFIDSLIRYQRKIKMPERKRVRFYAENVHDFAWVADPDFLVERHWLDSINIEIFYMKKDKKRWMKAGEYAVDAVKRYNKWFGKYPYKNLRVVDGCFAGGMEYPNLVIIGVDENFLTRSFESVISHEIAHQWFYGVLGSNEVDEAWLDEGFTTYAEIRYLEDKYGKNNSFFKPGLIPALTRRYFHKAIYYLTLTNQLEQPILTPAYKFLDVPIAYTNAAYSKPALFLFHLEGILGKETFTKILQEYFERYKFKHPKTDDFIELCEQISGQDLRPLFNALLNSTDFSDWRIKKIGTNYVQFENRGNLLLPVDVFIETDISGQIYRITQTPETVTLLGAKRIKKVIIDPYGYSLEANYWNNYYPAKIGFKPFLWWPSFEAYQLFFVPYCWYGSDAGFMPGIFFAGAEFVDFDFVKGKHQWSVSYLYGLKSRRHYPGFSYQTPLIFRKGWRTRISLRGSNSPKGINLKFGFIHNLGIPFANKPAVQFANTIAYYRANSDAAVDAGDQDTVGNLVFEKSFQYDYRKWHIGLGLFLGSAANYIKSTLKLKKEVELLPLNIRFFAGRIFGSAPKQEKLFRCSAMHIKTDQLYCLSFEAPANFALRIFADWGYYYHDKKTWTSAFGFGPRIVFGPLSFSVPIYTKIDQTQQLRWSIGF